MESRLYDIIRRPILTEKNTLLMETGRYTFEVSPEANKAEVKRAVELAFPNTTVLAVNIISVHAKRKNFSRKRKRINDWGPRWKKAVVTLAPGQRIEIFEGV
jgi:large subunit ribosomal protein L23